jgi:hypothetical protein
VNVVKPTDRRLLEYLSAHDRSVSGLALALRAIVLEEASQAVESISHGYAVAIGFSFTGRLKDGFCHIATYTHHVNLGLNRGASLPDPKKLLTGTGKAVRHIRIARESDLELPYLRGFIRAAIEQVRGPPETPTSAQKKRRPNPSR